MFVKVTYVVWKGNNEDNNNNNNDNNNNNNKYVFFISSIFLKQLEDENNIYLKKSTF